jgi:hypothetical protein
LVSFCDRGTVAVGCEYIDAEQQRHIHS